MRNVHSFARTVAVSALIAVSAMSTPAFAGKNDRAQEAIAVAKGKIEAADKVGAAAEAGGLQMQARDSLLKAQALLSDGKKDAAILEATHSGNLADQALVIADKRKVGAERGARMDAEAAAANAQQSAASADARANSAEQSAATANAQADAMRNAPPPAPVVVQAPAPTTTTTVATSEEREVVRTAPKPVVRRKVVHHYHHTPVKKNTVTVTTSQQ